MTYEEAKNILMAKADFSGTGEKAKLTADALCVAVDALEKAEKYAWHDLRKNPDDLPDVNSFVLCEWVGGSHNWHDVFIFDNDPRPHFRNTHGNMISIIGDEKFTFEGQVIAWREIEPFEAE